jgi:NAD(P)-dependent dehydrogenase (short-subunit alcohol dehydrogenase family)
MNIFITGGANGLGEAITRILAKDKNHTVFFTYNSSLSRAEALQKEFSNTVAIKCNFKDEAEVKNLAEKIETLSLDVLINNAYTGDPIKTYFHKIPVEDFSAGFRENILPVVTLTQSAIKGFRNKKSGKIITILSSYLLNTPPAGSSVYVANKAYLSSLVKTWATENARFNITSNSISPSFMQTGFTKDVDDRLIEQMIQNHPLKRLLSLEETAEAVLFFVNASQQVNGIDMIINAGVNIK